MATGTHIHQQTKSGQTKSGVSETINYVKDFFSTGSQSAGQRGMQAGVSAMIARTALRRLPPPLNLIAPAVVEKIILKYGVEEGREILLKSLRWVKKVTDEEPATAS
jgi:hypothetical protein